MPQGPQALTNLITIQYFPSISLKTDYKQQHVLPLTITKSTFLVVSVYSLDTISICSHSYSTNTAICLHGINLRQLIEMFCLQILYTEKRMNQINTVKDTPWRSQRRI